MNRREFLTMGTFPGVINVEEVQYITGFNSQFHIRILIKAGLLRPLGKPSPNGQKLFSSAEILALANDRDWVDRAVKAIEKAIREKNQKVNATLPKQRQQQG